MLSVFISETLTIDDAFRFFFNEALTIDAFRFYLLVKPSLSMMLAFFKLMIMRASLRTKNKQPPALQCR